MNTREGMGIGYPRITVLHAMWHLKSVSSTYKQRWARKLFLFVCKSQMSKFLSHFAIAKPQISEVCHLQMAIRKFVMINLQITNQKSAKFLIVPVPKLQFCKFSRKIAVFPIQIRISLPRLFYLRIYILDFPSAM